MINSPNLQNLVIISAATAPQRAAASDAAEMVNELLLGERAVLLDRDSSGRWLKVRALHDGYEGWVSVAQAYVYQDDEEAVLSGWKRSRSAGMLLEQANGNQLRVPVGALLPAEENGHIRFPFGSYEIIRQGADLPPDLLGAAKGFLGIPYLWGGRSDFGIDCSGLVQQLGFLFDIPFPRDASQQIKAYPVLSRNLKDALTGDLIYFSFDGTRIVHVGLYLGGGVLLHASGDVRMELIDPDKRKTSGFVFNERLSGAVAGIQRPGFTGST